jgi:uncharacterized membrane protein
MNELESVGLPIALLAAASGARMMTGIAAVARVRANEASAAAAAARGPGPRIARKFDRTIADSTAAMAVFELMADKSPRIPDRTAPASLLGRVAAGAVIGSSVARMSNVERRGPAIAGALVAFASAHLTFRLRAALSEQMPGFAAGLIEDVLILGIAAAGMAAADRR